MATFGSGFGCSDVDDFSPFLCTFDGDREFEGVGGFDLDEYVSSGNFRKKSRKARLDPRLCIVLFRKHVLPRLRRPVIPLNGAGRSDFEFPLVAEEFSGEVTGGADFASSRDFKSDFLSSGKSELEPGGNFRRFAALRVSLRPGCSASDISVFALLIPCSDGLSPCEASDGEWWRSDAALLLL